MEQLTNDLKARVDDLHALQEQQPPEEETAMLVQQVVLPVASGTPALMDIDGAPLTTMGPGRTAAEDVMPTIFGDQEEQEELEEEEQREMDGAEPRFIGLFRYLDELVDEGDIVEDREQRLIVSLTECRDNPAIWQAQCIALWKRLVEAAAETNSQYPTSQRTVGDQYRQNSADTVLADADD